MGFFDSIKKAKNYLTGGGVKIEIIQLDQPQLRKPFKLKVLIILEDGEIEADKIYLEIKNTEQLKMNVDIKDDTGKRYQRQETKYNILYEREYILDQMKLLQAYEKYTYEVEVNIPLHCFPSFKGVGAKYTWTVQAAIDKAGNNPESDLIYIEPEYTIS